MDKKPRPPAEDRELRHPAADKTPGPPSLDIASRPPALNELIRNPKWRLLTFRQAMIQAALALVLCALTAGFAQNRIYFVFAASAAGVLLLGRAWFSYLRWKDGREYGADIPRFSAFPRGKTSPRVPSILRGNPPQRPHRPAFLLNSEDFSDDLTRYTVAAEEDFSSDSLWLARIASALLAALVLIAASFVSG